MENVLSFLDVDTLLNELKSVDERTYKEFLEAFNDFQNIDFKKFIENDHLNEFAFTKFLINSQLSIIHFVKTLKEDDLVTIRIIAKIFKVYYLYHYSSQEVNSFKTYNFTRNISNALNLAAEFIDGLENSIVFKSIKKFINDDFVKISQSIAFESNYRKHPPLEGFIAGLRPEFKGRFKDAEFIPVLMKYLFWNDYIDRYGSWVEQERRKTEMLGLVYALKDLDFIDKADTFSKKEFCKAFNIEISRRYINSDERTQVSIDAEENFKFDLRQLYQLEIYNKRLPVSSI